MENDMIGRLLYLANARPPRGKDHKQRFYAMKQRICQRFGSLDGFDVQHFVGKQCFGCDGSGVHYYWSGDRDYCWRCGGSGWFKRERWVVLARWRIGVRIFHQPSGVSYETPSLPLRRTTIEGFIEHDYHGFWHDEAAMWLALLFDWKLLGMLLAEGTTYCKWPRWLGPMVQLKQLIGVARRLMRSLRTNRDSYSRRLKCPVAQEDIPF